MLRFLVNLCADLLPFARTRLTAQAACSVAAANTGLPTEALQGTMIWLVILLSAIALPRNKKTAGISICCLENTMQDQSNLIQKP